MWQAVDDRRGIALAQTAIGGIYSFYGEKERALSLLNQAVTIFRSMGDRRGQAVALNSVAAAYEDLNDLVTALAQRAQLWRCSSADAVSSALNSPSAYCSISDAVRSALIFVFPTRAVPLLWRGSAAT